MKNICDIKECTACGLCAVKCPTHSIELRKGKLGHLYPVINESTCVDCKLCIKNCPSLHVPTKRFPSNAYAAFAINRDDYVTSTSGAAASLFSQYIIKLGGVVYGCAVSSLNDKIDVKHIRIDSLDEINRLKGSKYVQSRIVDILPELKKDVEFGKSVLFIGTPCQVAAIRNLFPEEPNNLFLVDIICHGVPSLDYLQCHIQRVLKGNCVDNVRFRDESGRYVMQLFNKGEIEYQSFLFAERYKDDYINAFFDGYSFRESCYNCAYASEHRISDITIGDFWGLGKTEPVDQIPEHKNGISVLLPLTSKGSHLVSAISDDSYIIERKVEEAIVGNDQLMHPKKKTPLASLYRFLQPCFGYYMSYQIVTGMIKLRIMLGSVKQRLFKL